MLDPQLTVAAACVQAPEPLQVPVLPQGAVVLVGHWPLGAAVPGPMGAQVPMPLRLQALQVPHEALPQQTPSVQKPVMHWVPEVQERLFALSAQLFVLPEPWQVKGARQSLSAVQVVLQAVVPQT